MRKVAILIALMGVIGSLKAQHYVISGRVIDNHTKENLIGCNIIETVSGKGATTNSYGLYSLTIPHGKCKLAVSYLGYDSFNLDFDLKKDTMINIFLAPIASELQEVTITAVISVKLTSVYI